MTLDKPRIIIVDDDHYPEGRVSQRIMPEFNQRKLGLDVRHYITFDEMRKNLESGDISKNDLFVLDSTLEEEPDMHIKEFMYIIPALRDLGVKFEHMMPASGAGGGKHNNEWFQNYVEGQGRALGWNQMNLKERGLVGDPIRVVDQILEYYKELNPTVSLEQEYHPIGESLQPLR